MSKLAIIANYNGFYSKIIDKGKYSLDLSISSTKQKQGLFLNGDRKWANWEEESIYG